MIKKKIKVTEKHISSGIRRAGDACPIAKALNDAGYSNVIITRQICIVKGHKIELPVDVKLFIMNFDRGRTVKPFSFTITLPKA